MSDRFGSTNGSKRTKRSDDFKPGLRTPHGLRPAADTPRLVFVNIDAHVQRLGSAHSSPRIVATLDAVELATLEWVDWFETRRRLEPIG